MIEGVRGEGILGCWTEGRRENVRESDSFKDIGVTLVVSR